MQDSTLKQNPLIHALESADFTHHKAYILRHIATHLYLHTIADFGAMPTLLGLESQAKLLADNTEAFLQGRPTLHALLYGARGCGKSSLVKATLLQHLLDSTSTLRVLELDSRDMALLPVVCDVLRTKAYKFIIFCDDLSYRLGDDTYRSLKSTLQGSLEARASNILLYATSNIRRIVESTKNLAPSDEITQEELALSDRFGLQIGFYDMGVKEYLHIVASLLGDENITRHPTQDERDTLAPHDILLQTSNQQASTRQMSSTRESAHAGTCEIAPHAYAPHTTSQLRQAALNFATKMGSFNARIAEEFVIFWRNHRT